MKLEKLKLVIVLASTWLFCVAQSPSPIPGVSVQPQAKKSGLSTPDAHHQESNANGVAAVEHPKSANPTCSSTSDQTRDNKPIEMPWYDNFQLWQVVFDGLLVIATIFIAVFTGQMRKATRAATLAADKSADVAEKALRADRPYLLIESVTLENFRTEHESASNASIVANFILENFGKSPAIIEKIRARLAITKTLKPLKSDALLKDEEPFPQFGDYGRCAWVEPLRNVIGAGGRSDTYRSELATYRLNVTRGHIATETFDLIMRHALVVVLHGFVQYTDVLQRKHETEFRGLYNPPSADEPMGSFNFKFDDHPQRENEGG